MRFDDVGIFAEYYEKIRRRTLNLIDVIPADAMDWTPIDGEFTFAALNRHLTSEHVADASAS